jgi:hypothetical protein
VTQMSGDRHSARVTRQGDGVEYVGLPVYNVLIQAGDVGVVTGEAEVGLGRAVAQR